jgi:hypothetical protein
MPPVTVGLDTNAAYLNRATLCAITAEQIARLAQLNGGKL